VVASAQAHSGDLEGALRLADQAIASYRAKLPKDHLQLAQGLELRAILRAVAGRPDLARADAEEALGIREVYLRRAFAFADEHGMYPLAAPAADTLALFPMIVGGKPVEGEAARTTYEWVMRLKGVVLETLSRYRRARPLLEASPELASKAEHWRALRQQIAD